MKAGDRVVLKKGVWKDTKFVFHGEGTKNKPITLTVEDPKQTSIEGYSSLQLYGNYLIVDGLVFVNGCSPTGQVIEFRKGKDKTANNSILRNCVIDSYNKPDRMSEDAWVNLWGRYNEVSNCYFGGKTNQGVTLIVWPEGEGHNKNYHRIYRNYFGARPRLGANGGETIRIGTSFVSMDNSNTIVEGNYFEHCNGEVEIVSVKSCENRIINNTFFESEGSVVLRHGNRNEVSGNYFLGNHKPSIGGVRIINEGYKVFNNYFYALRGKDFRGPLVIMNGVYNSAQNRYHQVKDAEICFNTWVDCELPWQLCVGSDEERKAIPLNVKIAHNLVYCPQETELVKAFDKITGFTINNNLLIGSKGNEKGEGYVDGVVKQTQGANGFPLIFAQVSTNDNVPYVINDIEGNKRGNRKNIGAMQSGSSSNTEIASANNCGPRWYKPNKASVEHNKIVRVASGKDMLLNAISTSKAGDIIELDGGVYTNTQQLTIPHTLTIRAAANAKNKPIIKGDGSANLTSLIELKSSLRFSLDGVYLDGAKTTKYGVSTVKQGAVASYTVYINNCEFANFSHPDGGAIYKAYKHSFADTLLVSNTIFRDSFSGFALNEEKDAKGFYNAEFMIFNNVVFKNIQQWAIDFLRGGNDESTLGGHLLVDHCVFDNVNNKADAAMIEQVGLITIDIKNSIFANSPLVKYPIRLFGRHNGISYSNIYNASKLSYLNSAIEGKGMMYINPDFDKNNYALKAKSPLKGKSSTGNDMGFVAR
ncbi:MAG: hypothetical protein RL662_802 [Bacteroidota bacterium]